MSNKNKQPKKQNPPNYLSNTPKDLIEIQREHNNEINTTPIIIPKFRLGIDKNCDAIITIDNVMHFMTQEQHFAFLKGNISIAKKMYPETDFSELLEQ